MEFVTEKRVPLVKLRELTKLELAGGNFKSTRNKRLDQPIATWEVSCAS